MSAYKAYVCSMCGHIVLDGSVPEHCPVCGAPKSAFKEDSKAIVSPSAETDKVELNKKHIPQIVIEKKCGLIPGGCIDAHIKVGEIVHPMLAEHFIKYLDIYIDKKFVSRTTFQPLVLNPATCLHLKLQKGAISVISRCNLHGSWLSEKSI